jgi:hypothetical protein
MARTAQAPEVDRMAVTARALAFLCVRQAQVESETLLDKATFLERFGIPLGEAATILGTTQKSLTEMERQQKTRRSKATTKKAAAKRSTGSKRRG